MCSEPRDEASHTLENLSLSSSQSTVAIIVLRDKPAQPSGPQRPALVRGSCTPGSAGPGWVRFCSLSVELLLGLAAGSPGCAPLTGVPENEASRASALKAVACLPWADIPLAKTSHAGKSQVRGRRRRLPAPRARSRGAEWTTAELVRGFGRRVRWGKSPFGSLWAFVSLLTQRRGRRRPAVPSEAALESPGEAFHKHRWRGPPPRSVKWGSRGLRLEGWRVSDAFSLSLGRSRDWEPLCNGFERCFCSKTRSGLHWDWPVGRQDLRLTGCWRDKHVRALGYH